VTTYEQLLATRALMGISEAFYIPAALALIADFHTGGTRSRAVGLHQMGIYVGVIIGGFGGYVADHPGLGWRVAFDACGIAGIAYAVPLFFLLRNPVRPADAPHRPRTSPLGALRELLGTGSFILLVLYFTLPALAGWIVRDWMPAILKAEFGIGQGLAGVSATIYWQSAAIVGAITGGWLADRWMRRTPRGRIYVSAIGMALIVPAMFGVGYAPQTGLLAVAVAFLILFGLGWGFFDSNNMPILCQVARPELRATGYGIMNFVSISCGGFADWGFGALRDRHVPLFGIFGVFASCAIVSIVLVLLIRPRSFER
jgi:MFS family permease